MPPSARRRAVPALFCALALCTLPCQSAEKPKPQAQAKAIHDTMFVREEGVTPFRLTAAFHSSDFQGKPQTEGSLEEFWLKPGFWKVVARYGDKTVTLYASNDQHSITGASFLPLIPSDALFTLRGIAPSLRQISEAPRMDRQTIDTHGAKLECVAVASKIKLSGPLRQPITDLPAKTYCADDKNIVHAVQQPAADQVQFHSGFIQLAGKYLPRDITVQRFGQDRLTLHIANVSPIPALSEADIAPPADAAIVYEPADQKEGPVPVPAHRKNEVRMERHDIVFGGMGRIQVIIDRDGLVKDMDVANASSKEFAEMMTKILTQQTYDPATYNGVPVPQRLTQPFSIK